jgi:alpha-tubulin suppressor-like RCC1 family protein
VISGGDGSGHTCGVTTSHVGYCWGRNNFGQLGDGTTTDRPTPVPVAGAM